MAFKHYLEEEDDKPYFTTNSLGYYYDKMEGFAEKVEQAAKVLNVTKEEVEKNIAAYIEQNKNELDQRLADWDGKLETFDSSVETLLTEWVDDGTLTPLIDSTLIDQRLAPVTAQLAVTDAEAKRKRELEDLSPTVLSAIEGGAGTSFNLLSIPQDNSVDLNKVNFAKKSSNLYNDSTTTNDFYLASNGVPTANAKSRTSDYIPVTGTAKYYIRFAQQVAYYDTNKTLISYTSEVPGADTVLTIPASAKYMRFSWNAPLTIQQVNAGEVRLPYETFYQYINKAVVEPKKVTLQDVNFVKRGGKNLIDNSKMTDKRRLDTVTYAPVYDVLYAITDYIELPVDNDFAFVDVTNALWFDSSFVLLRADASVGVTKTKPSGAVYLRVTVPITAKDKAQIEVGTARTIYEPYREVIDSKYLDIPKQNIAPPVVSIDDTVARKSIIEERAARHIPNVPTTLNIPSYVPDGIGSKGDITHPNVLYFKNGWNGYKFWMVMTPYPGGNNNLYENPSIIASNDNITWVAPAPNPIAPLESTDGYQSDPDIFMRGNTMEMWYRTHILQPDGVSWRTTVYRKTSTNGVSWTVREKMFDDVNFDTVLSPSLVFEDNLYKMWYIAGVDKQNMFVKYAESADGKTWEKRILDVKLDSDFTFWHSDVYKHPNGKVDLVFSAKSDTKPWSIFYSYSHDNINFSPAALLIKPTTTSGLWDSYVSGLYKPALVLVDDEYYLYYATPVKVGLTTGKSMLELGWKGEVDYKSFPIKTIRTDRDSFSMSDTFDKYPPFTITYTAIWSGANTSWMGLSGIVKTENIFNQAAKTRQYFYVDGEDRVLMRTATASGWTTFKTISMT